MSCFSRVNACIQEFTEHDSYLTTMKNEVDDLIKMTSSKVVEASTSHATRDKMQGMMLVKIWRMMSVKLRQKLMEVKRSMNQLLLVTQKIKVVF